LVCARAERLLLAGPSPFQQEAAWPPLYPPSCCPFPGPRFSPPVPGGSFGTTVSGVSQQVQDRVSFTVVVPFSGTPAWLGPPFFGFSQGTLFGPGFLFCYPVPCPGSPFCTSLCLFTLKTSPQTSPGPAGARCLFCTAGRFFSFLAPFLLFYYSSRRRPRLWRTAAAPTQAVVEVPKGHVPALPLGFSPTPGWAACPAHCPGFPLHFVGGSFFLVGGPLFPARSVTCTGPAFPLPTLHRSLSAIFSAGHPCWTWPSPSRPVRVQAINHRSPLPPFPSRPERSPLVSWHPVVASTLHQPPETELTSERGWFFLPRPFPPAITRFVRCRVPP